MLIIRPKKKFGLDDIKEVWQHRELLYFFTWRDIKVRYKQTAIGVLWAIIQPLIYVVVFSIFFGKFGKIPSEGVPYPIFVFSGLLFWQLFSTALTEASTSLVTNAPIITKVYFPRIILPISVVFTKLIDFLISCSLLVVLMIYYKYTPDPKYLILFPILVILTCFVAITTGLFLAALNVKYRDVRYALPFFIQLFLFLTPVVYPVSITGAYSWILAINPLTGIINTARFIILGTGGVDWNGLLFSIVFILIVGVIGLYRFKKAERYFADIV